MLYAMRFQSSNLYMVILYCIMYAVHYSLSTITEQGLYNMMYENAYGGFHLQYCANLQCNIALPRCNMCYRICDGVNDCINGVDEWGYPNVISCVRTDHVCDGIIYCPLNYDEFLGGSQPCLTICFSLSLAIYCLQVKYGQNTSKNQICKIPVHCNHIRYIVSRIRGPW